MVRGMPLKEMHLRPISRRSSAVERGVRVEEGEVRVGMRSWSSRSAAGELRVNVAAAWEARRMLVRFWVCVIFVGVFYSVFLFYSPFEG